MKCGCTCCHGDGNRVAAICIVDTGGTGDRDGGEGCVGGDEAADEGLGIGVGKVERYDGGGGGGCG